MYCPGCGEAEQKKDSYCRKCGVYLADFGKIKRSERPAQENFTANTVLTAMTGIASLSLAIILYAMFLGKDDTPVIIYVVAGFLTAMFFWQLQLFIRTLQLKKQFRARADAKDDETLPQTQESFESNPTKELLPEADFTEIVPASVTERTTKNLGIKIERSSKTEE